MRTSIDTASVNIGDIDNCGIVMPSLVPVVSEIPLKCLLRAMFEPLQAVYVLFELCTCVCGSLK